MKKPTIDRKTLQIFVPQHLIEEIQPEVDATHTMLKCRSGPGADFLGWLDLPEKAKEQLNHINNVAEEIKRKSQALVVIGIGGSFLGAKAGIDALAHTFHNLKDDTTKVFFAGHNLCGTYHSDLIEILKNMDFSINVISKSGTTIEPAIAFRVLKNLLEQKYGKKEAKKRVYVTTDTSKGILKSLAEQEGYSIFEIPEDVGGRYSVISPVGLLPMAVAGIDVEALVEGAGLAKQDLDQPDLAYNPCYQYAAVRTILHRQGKSVELLTAYEPALRSFTEWWKQLFGESEGKDQKGIFPASAIFSTDLHSLGQFIQDGPRILFVTVLKVNQPRKKVTIPMNEQDLDLLNYLGNKDMDFANSRVYDGTISAHTDGQVPNVVIQLPDLTATTLGYLFYFMEKACAISAYMLGVNPFDQPGVEAYKRKMSILLGKPE